MAELKQSKNNGLIVGTLSEKALEIVDAEQNGKKCKAIRGKLAIETDKGTFEVQAYQKSLTTKGEANGMYESLYKVMEEYKDKTTGNPDTVKCKVNISVNDYANKRGEISTTTRIRLNGCNRVDSAEFNTDIDLEGYIDAIIPETKNEEETGRLLVKFMMTDYSGNAQPFELVVGEDLASDFEDMYSVGDCALLYCELTMTHVGGAPSGKKAAFGRKANVVSGFDKFEIIVVGGEEPYDVEDDDYDGFVLTKKDVKNLKADREVLLESILAKAKEESGEKKGKYEKKPIKPTRVEDSEEFEDPDCPF